MSQLDSVVFGDKKFSDILEEIYNNQKKKSEQVTALISELKPLVQEIGDATLIVPLIKEYMEIGVKNDDALIKMATIIQRVVNNSNEDGGLGITEDEKDALLAEMEKIQFKKRRLMPRESLFGFLKSSSNKSGMGNTGGIFSARVRYVMLEGETHPEVFKQYGVSIYRRIVF